MTIWVDQPIPSGPRALRIDTMTLRERCQYLLCMMGQHLQQGLESPNLLTITPLRILCVGSVTVAVAVAVPVAGGVRSPSNCNAMVQVYGSIAVCIFFFNKYMCSVLSTSSEKCTNSEVVPPIDATPYGAYRHFSPFGCRHLLFCRSCRHSPSLRPYKPPTPLCSSGGAHEDRREDRGRILKQTNHSLSSYGVPVSTIEEGQSVCSRRRRC